MGSFVVVVSLLVARVLCRGRSRLQRACSGDRFVAGEGNKHAAQQGAAPDRQTLRSLRSLHVWRRVSLSLACLRARLLAIEAQNWRSCFPQSLAFLRAAKSRHFSFALLFCFVSASPCLAVSSRVLPSRPVFSLLVPASFRCGFRVVLFRVAFVRRFLQVLSSDVFVLRFRAVSSVCVPASTCSALLQQLKFVVFEQCGVQFIATAKPRKSPTNRLTRRCTRPPTAPFVVPPHCASGGG